MFEPTLAYNYGLFVNQIEISDEISSATPEVKWIKGSKMEDNGSIMDLTISLDNIVSPEIKIVDTYKGHEGSYFKALATYGEGDKLNEYYESLIKSKLGEDATVNEIVASGTQITKNSIEDPFRLSATAKVPSLVEVAGTEYLFKIGNVIGEQVQMYQKKERLYNAEVQFPHFYKRTIKFTIPEGYQVDGLGGLKIDLTYGNDEGKTIGFTSDYTIKNNTVSVEVYEFYKETTYSLDQFEEFRTVINAAADFNKIVILFTKK